MSLGQAVRRAAANVSGAPAAPVNTAAPVVSPSLVVTGGTLTTTNGTWTGSPTPTFTYQWKKGGVNIGGATTSSYVTVGGDAGAAITCVVTATNGSGSANATSNTVTPATSVNLLTNGSFEHDGTGVAPAGWTRSVGNEVTAASTFTGSAGSKTMIIGNGLTQAHGITQTVASPVTVGTSYMVTARFQQLVAAGGSLFVAIIWLNSGGVTLSTSTGAVDGAPGLNATGTVTVTATAPANAVTAQAVVAKGFDTRQFQVDAIMFAPTAQGGTYADGDTASWTWSGTVGNSTSKTP